MTKEARPVFRLFGRGPVPDVGTPTRLAQQSRSGSRRHRRAGLAPRAVDPIAEAESFESQRPPRPWRPSPRAEPAATRSWWQRLKEGLTRSSSAIGQGIGDIFLKRKLDAATLEELEDVLIQADLGVDTAARIAGAVGEGRYDKQIARRGDPGGARRRGREDPGAGGDAPGLDAAPKPFVILMVGVNGSGKTTTIGKLAAKVQRQGRSVMLAAGDTFRAAAIEQLKIWGARTGAPVVARAQGADAAGLAFDALTEAGRTARTSSSSTPPAGCRTRPG